MERYPENIKVGIEEFRNSGWKQIIESISGKGNGAAFEALSSSAKIQIRNGKISEGKVLWLLADACSMMLRPPSINEPFGPLAVFDGNRSAIPADFKEDEILFFIEIVEEIEFAWLRARLADLVWLLSRPRNHRYALMAIDSYRRISIDLETWLHGGRECWARAIRLALLLKAGAGDRALELQNCLIEALETTSIQDGFLPLWISVMLRECGMAKEKSKSISEKMESLAKAAQNHNEFRKSREFIEESSEWYSILGDQENVIRTAVFAADTWEKEARSRPEPMVQSQFLENAIHKYRSIPKIFREEYKIEEKIASLHLAMNLASKEALTQLTRISSGDINLSDIIASSKKAVQGKDAEQALASLANIHHGANKKKIQEFCESQFKDHIFSALISVTHYARDGRVIAKRPGIDPTDMNSRESKEALFAEMVRHYTMEIGMYVQACIWPALQVLNLEHRFNEADFVEIASQSPIVPPGRDGLFGKALFFGYDREFSAAIHLIVPQIEHLVRYQLKLRNIKTTTIDKNGIENEIGLSSLVDIPEVDEIFGEDFTFELTALFCNPFGPNLRNEIAHGLVEYSMSESVNSIYTWWLALRIVFNTFWNRRTKLESQ